MASVCGSICPSEGIFYAYQPNLGGNIFLLVAFALLVPIVCLLGFRFRSPVFALVLSMGLLLEIIGFLGRLLLRKQGGNRAFSALSLFGTILGPTFISGSIFVVLPHTLSIYGERLSPVKPITVGTLACALIAAAGLLQLIGLCFLVSDFEGLSQTQSTGVITGGIGLQAVCHIASITLYAWFHQGLLSQGHTVDLKHSRVYQSPRFKLFIRATGAATALLITYCIYRMVEIALGVDGSLFQNEIIFMIMNGGFPLVASLFLTAFHPGAAFGSAWAATSPRRVRQPAPPPLSQTPGYRPHHRYNPSIRSQISPTSRKSVSSNPPEVPAGSPGLPASPKPVSKPPSPRTAHIPPATIDKRISGSFEPKPPVTSKNMVDREALW